MPKLQSFPEFDSSQSNSDGDDRRVVVMKGALMSEVVQLPRVLTEYPRWAVKTGLQKLMDDVATGKKSAEDLIAAIPSAAKQLHEEAVSLAAALGLPFRWVARDLLHGFGAGLVGIATGHEIALPLPQIMTTRDTATKRPSGRRPDEETLARYAQWYVHHRVSGITVNKLAQKYCEAHHRHPSYRNGHTWQNDRKTVLDGIKEIDHLLRLTH